MKRFILFLTILTSLFIQSSCVEEDYFGLSPFGRIKALELSNQASSSQINKDSALVRITFPPGIDLTAIKVNLLTLSSFATSDLKVGDILNMSEIQEVHVTAENGSITLWKIVPGVAGANPQLPNADFDTWYTTQGGYLEPGESADNTIWGTGNPGTQILNIIATTPFELADGTNAARLETKYNGAIPAAFGTPISAATIYIGAFNSANLDPADPEAAIDFGTPFSGRPSSFRIDYAYTPGEENQDKGQNPLGYSDQCDIYLLLELRDQSETRRLATGWFRSSDNVPDLTTIEIPLTYGELDDSFPDYMKPDGQEYVSADSAQFVLPTHITFVATSSFDGANFAGAVGSVLFVDNLELVYE